MDINKYIASGILEQYVLDLLSEADRGGVEAMIQKYPEIREEVVAIEDALETYAGISEISPPPELEAQILQKIKSDSKTKTVTPHQNTSSDILKYLLAFLLISVTLLSAWLYNQHQTTKSALTSLQSDYAQLLADCNRQQESLNQLLNQMRIIRETGNIHVQMKGSDNAPQAIVNVYYNNDLKKTWLDILNLPTPPNNKQYQLWAIVDGAPVDMGVFDLLADQNNILQEVPFIENPQAFAVTLERKGGNPTPTLPDMLYVIGNFPASG